MRASQSLLPAPVGVPAAVVGGTRVARVALAGILASVVAALALSAAPALAAGPPTVTVPTGSCPNEALRAESNPDPQTGIPYSMQLPDCRAYEQVTPPSKSINAVIPGDETRLGTAITEAISSDGSTLLEVSLPLLGEAGADGELNPTFYELGRGASGWATTSLTPPASVFPIATEQLASTADVAVGLWSAATPSQSIKAEDFYQREADGSFLNIGPIAPPSATAGPPHGAESTTSGPRGANGIVGASTDLSHVVFQLDAPSSEAAQSYLWPGDGTLIARPSLYEYAGSGHTGEGDDVPALVGVDNAGGQIGECGTGLGADVEPEISRTVHNGVSAGGSTIFFNVQGHRCAKAATGPASDQLYARIGSPGAAQATVNVAGTSECATSVSCDVTKPVTYQASSKDGSRVFFTTTQALLPSDTDTTSDIYECELPGDGGATPAPSGVVNACPDLKAVSVTGTGVAAKVQSVVAVSAGGSRVYFTAAGVLTSEPNLSLPSGHQVALEGMHNLYVWEAPSEGNPTGHTAFIATLSKASPEYAQATPDGRYLVFTSARKLTPDDTSTVAQAFRFDAQTGELIRVSVGQDGFNNDGNTRSDPASLAGTNLGRLTVSEDGSYIVFQSSDALTPQVQGGSQNVYEWHDGNVYLISDGTDTQARAKLMGMDASGANVFFTTADKLVRQDTDEDIDVYDARIDGGFPAPIRAVSCSRDACQGPLSSSPAPPLPGSMAPPAIGNAAPATGGVLASKTRASGSAGKVQITKQSVKGSTVTLSVKVPAKGAISVSGSGLKTVKRSVSKSATYTLKLTFTTAGKASLRRHHRLKVKIKVVFKPSTGSSSSATKTVTFKA